MKPSDCINNRLAGMDAGDQGPAADGAQKQRSAREIRSAKLATQSQAQ